MAEWGKSKHGMYIIGGWWCGGRLHHHKTEATADLCDRTRALRAASKGSDR